MKCFPIHASLCGRSAYTYLSRYVFYHDFYFLFHFQLLLLRHNNAPSMIDSLLFSLSLMEAMSLS